ncbi:MAG: hypothetical protein SH859_01030 [Hyphomicrobium aestuarii]|nr:hypothetical protein [Hyphomicrobium aestuarii]
MPNINLKDGRNRDARVRAESVGERATVRYVDQAGQDVRMKKVLRATAEHSYDRLKSAASGDDEALAANLVTADTDVDLERIGMFLTGASRVFVNRAGEIVTHITETEVVRAPSGEEKERRPRKRPEPNTDGDLPVSWTGRLIKKDEALRRFVFSSKLQIVHVNGLTYDFLYSMAKELHEAGSLMLLGAGKSGKDPLIFTRHATPHRGFLEGRTNGDTYVLLLHLSKMELKAPVAVEPVVAAHAAATAAQIAPNAVPAAVTPIMPPVTEHPAAPPAIVPPAAEPVPLAATQAPAQSRSRRPTVRDITSATSAEPAIPANAKPEIAAVTEGAKTARARASRPKAKTPPAEATGPAAMAADQATPEATAPAAPARKRSPKPSAPQ